MIYSADTAVKNEFNSSNWSLRKRIPVLICMLLVAVISIYIMVSYISLKNFEIKVGQQRLKFLTGEVSNMLASSIKDVTANTEKTASSTEVINYLNNRVGDSDAIHVLKQLGEDGTSMLIELRDVGFNVLLSVGSASYRGGVTETTKSADSTEWISAGNIYAIHDSVFYPIVVPVKTGDGISGYVTRYRYVKITSRNLEQFSNLAGKGAVLYVGNNDHSLYTDLFHPANYVPPNMPLKEGEGFETILPDGDKMMGAIHYIKGTPWHSILLFSRRAMLQGSTQFLVWLIMIGLVLVVLGIAGAWIMSGRLTRPLNTLTLAVSNFASGDVHKGTAIKGDEVKTLTVSFNVMMERLRLGKIEMEQKIIESQALNSRLRSLSSHLQHAREQERRHVAKELHDELGQLLAAFRMDIHLMKKRLPNDSNVSLHEGISSMESEMDNAMKIVKRVSSELRGGPLDDLGLHAAIEWYCEGYTKRFGIPVEFHVSDSHFPCSAAVGKGLFSICQEALTNAAKHAEPTRVMVSLVMKDERLILAVTDNGKGFDVHKVKSDQQLGLIGISERVIIMGGSLHITSAPLKGTAVEVIVPLKEPVNLSALS